MLEEESCIEHIELQKHLSKEKSEDVETMNIRMRTKYEL